MMSETQKAMILWIAVMAAMTAFCFSAGLASAAPEKRIALVIGNTKYSDDIGKLTNPGNDARLIEKALEGVGFEVSRIEDVTRRQMRDAIAAFGERLRAAGPNSIGLFYFAGHGFQVQGRNWLLPIGAKIRSEADVEDEAVRADYILEQMDLASNQLNILILDACRNNPFKRFRGGQRGLAPVRSAPPNTLVSYATAADETADDGAGSNSPYALALAAEISGGSDPVETTIRKVTKRVKDATNNRQVPYFTGSIDKEFRFRSGGVPTSSVSVDPRAFNVQYIRLDSTAYAALFDTASGANRAASESIFGGRTLLVPNEVHQTYKQLLDNYGTEIDQTNANWEVREKTNRNQTVQIQSPPRVLDPLGNVWFPDMAATETLLKTRSWPSGYQIVPHSFWECGEIGSLRPPILWRTIAYNELAPAAYRQRMREFVTRFGPEARPFEVPTGFIAGSERIRVQETEAERRLRLYTRLAGDRWPVTLMQAQIGSHGSAVNCGSGNWYFRLTNLNIWITVAVVKATKEWADRLSVDAIGGSISKQSDFRAATQSLEGGVAFKRRVQSELFAGGTVAVLPMKIELFRVPPPGSKGAGSNVDWLESWTEKSNQFEGDVAASAKSVTTLRSLSKPDGTISFLKPNGTVWLSKVADPLLAASIKRDPGRFSIGPSIIPTVIGLAGGKEIALRKFDPSIQLVNLSTHGFVVSQCPNLYVRRNNNSKFAKVGPILQHADGPEKARWEYRSLGAGIREVMLLEEEGETTSLANLSLLGRPRGEARYVRIASSNVNTLNYGESVVLKIESPQRFEDVTVAAAGHYTSYDKIAEAHFDGSK